MDLPFDRFLNMTYFFATENADEKDKDKFDIRLNMPDARALRTGAAIAPGSMWSKENEEAALAGFVASLSAGGS